MIVMIGTFSQYYVIFHKCLNVWVGVYSDANSSPRPSRPNQGFRRRTSSDAGIIYATTNCHRLFQYYSIFRTRKPVVIRTCVSKYHWESIFDDFCWVTDFFRFILRSSVDQWRYNLCAEHLLWRYFFFFS